MPTHIDELKMGRVFWVAYCVRGLKAAGACILERASDPVLHRQIDRRLELPRLALAHE